MAKKKAEETPVETPPEVEKKKAAGRTIGAWRKDALNYLGKGASDSDVTAHINKVSAETGYDYTTTDEETAEWRARVQAELDGTAPTPSPRGSRTAAPKAEPTLTDLMAVLGALKEEELPQTDKLSPIEAWTEIISRVEALASKAGGLDNLKRCLTVAGSLTSLTK